jgi:PAS domain S-box-containing protein
MSYAYPIVLLFGAVAYATLGYGINYSNISAISMTAFWPPAGLALALALTYGNRIWPAIFIGAWAVTAFSETSSDEPIDQLLLATGATLQMLAGSYFIRLFSKPPFNLETAKQIFVVLFFGAFIACLSNIIFVKFSMMRLGHETAENIAATASLDYLYNVFSVAIFAPIFIITLAQDVEVRLRRKLTIFGCVAFLIADMLLIGSYSGMPFSLETTLVSMVSLLLIQSLVIAVTGQTAINTRLAEENASYMREMDHILENAMNEIYIIDRESQQILYINEAGIKHLGYNNTRQRPYALKDIIAEKDLEEITSSLEKIKTGAEEKIEFHTRFLSKEGKNYPVNVLLKATHFHYVPAFLIIAHETSVLVKTEHELDIQRSELEMIFNNVPVRIWYKNSHNKILRLNPAAAKSMGGNVEDFIGRNAYEVFPEMAKKYHDDDLEVISTRKAKLGIIEKYTPLKGQHGIVRTDKIPYFDPETGEATVLTVMQDVTELQDAEEKLEQAFEEIGQSQQGIDRIAYIASHDLQEPLRMVRNFSRLIEKRYGEELGATAKSYLTIVESSASQMQDIIDDLLDYARIEERSKKLEVVDPYQMIEYLKTSLRDQIRQHGVTITSDEPMPTISASPMSLSNILGNLLSNAITYHREGVAPAIHIGVKEESKRWVFSVKDNGKGIPAEHLEDIFKPFKRNMRPEGTQKGGSGMGLAICHKTAQSLGGELWVESTVGEGSTFYFSVPKQDWEME